MISTLFHELENRKRQRHAEMMVNKFASIQDTFLPSEGDHDLEYLNELGFSHVMII